MKSWRWVGSDLVYAIHEIQLARYGGLDGIRDKNAIDSALSRSEQQHTYGDPKPDAADLAAAYTYGLVRNHGFSDGNKRTAWVTGRVFLADNGISLQFGAFDAIKLMEGVAAGSISETELSDWFRHHMVAQK